VRWFRNVLLALSVAAAVWALLLLFVPAAGQDGLFFCAARARHFFDFFCPRAVLSAARPYAEPLRSCMLGEVLRTDQCYPALAVFVSGLFDESFAGAIACQALGGAFYLLGAALVLRKYGACQPLAVASLAVCAPFLFAAEVGNQILFAAGASCVFLAWYDSSSHGRRIVAAAMLAVAAVLKISPALLGLAYLSTPGRRNVRGALMACGLFVVLLLVPFAFLGGGDAFCAWLENARVNARTYALRNAFGPYGLVSELAHVVGYHAEVMSVVHTPLRLLSSAFAVGLLACAFAKRRDEFSRVCLIALGMLTLPPTMMCYTVLYVVPLFVAGTFGTRRRLQKAFALCWLFSCIPLQVPLMLGSAGACFFAAALLDLCWLLVRNRETSDGVSLCYNTDLQ